MANSRQYSPISQRNWRSQRLPVHLLINEMDRLISEYLNQLTADLPIEVSLSTSLTVEAAVGYTYRQWIENKADYAESLHEAGVQLYSTVVIQNPVKEQMKVYLKERTVAQIDAIGTYLETTKFYTPMLHSPRWKNRYNRKLIIVLCMNALSEALKADVVK